MFLRLPAAAAASPAKRASSTVAREASDSRNISKLIPPLLLALRASPRAFGTGAGTSTTAPPPPPDDDPSPPARPVNLRRRDGRRQKSREESGEIMEAQSGRNAAAEPRRMLFDKISPPDLEMCDWTSRSLYRLLLREVRSATSAPAPTLLVGGGGASAGVVAGADGRPILLQPPVDPRDYGAWRHLRGDGPCPPWRPGGVGRFGGIFGDGFGGGSDASAEVEEEDDDDSFSDDDNDYRGGRENARSVIDFFLRWGHSSVPDEIYTSSEITSDGGGGIGRGAADLIAAHLRGDFEGQLDVDDYDDDTDADNNEDDDDDDDDDYGDDYGYRETELPARSNPHRHLLVSRSDLTSALRRSFLRASHHDHRVNSPSSLLTKPDIVRLHRLAIEAAGTMRRQSEMFDQTVVTFDRWHGVRVTACSVYTGTTPDGERCFAYRIRLENVAGRDKEGGGRVGGGGGSAPGTDLEDKRGSRRVRKRGRGRRPRL